MQKFTIHTGIAALLLHNDIDTDAIIPSKEMRLVSKTGLGEGLFAGWRYLDAETRTPNPNFILNQEYFKHASVLISGKNFGCGSSREHAVWALHDFGIRCMIAESFGLIFAHNCTRNGILAIAINETDIQQIVAVLESATQPSPITVDLVQQTLSIGSSLSLDFEVEQRVREVLMEGLDPIRATQKLQPQINEWREKDRTTRPWLYKIKQR